MTSLFELIMLFPLLTYEKCYKQLLNDYLPPKKDGKYVLMPRDPLKSEYKYQNHLSNIRKLMTPLSIINLKPLTSYYFSYTTSYYQFHKTINFLNE